MKSFRLTAKGDRVIVVTENERSWLFELEGFLNKFMVEGGALLMWQRETVDNGIVTIQYKVV